MNGRRRVVLLRHQRADDPFVRAFAGAGFDARCVPVLSFEFVNEEQLTAALGRAQAYAGLVLTSPRAAEALARAGVDLAAWRGKRNFVVGSATGAGIRELGLRAEGEASGSAEALLPLIARSGVDLPLLFLSGDRRRDTLPEGLRAAGVLFHEIVVYKTGLRNDFEQRSLADADWLVFFSPTGVESVLASGFELRAVPRIAAIGLTTAEALREAGYPPAAVAAQPHAASLVRAVQQHENPKHGS